jgi:CheY-like chemotaxis protein/HPt (histidine-containing phosphotransfer) domain-containing protein
VTRAEALSVDAAEAAGTLILVAEDHANNRKVLGHQLSMLGYTAEMAVDGMQAREMWQKRRYGLILTDCHMPEMDGFQLTAEIRRLEGPTGRRVPIIAVTANAMKGEADRCIRAGMDDYLSKPLLIAQLQAALEKWLKRGTAAPGGPAGGNGPAAARVVDPGAGPVRRGALVDALGTDDPATINEFFHDFLESSLKVFDGMKASHAADSPADVGGLAHRFTSSAATIGADDLARYCRELESACKLDDRNEIDRLYERVGESFADVQRWIHDHAAQESR